MSKILVTGAAGFIGFHTSLRLLKLGRAVVGYDAVNDYYDPELKMARLSELQKFPGFTFVKGDIADKPAMENLWKSEGPFLEVIHLAAQAGVRYSLENPYTYITSNCMGHVTVMEMCRHTLGFKHLVYASSSSVYGKNEKTPYSVQDDVNRPISLYAATKRADELLSYSYSHLFALPQTGLRFFTAYGPWGRPDHSLFIFTQAIRAGRKVPIFNNGDMRRDYTYIDDIVSGILGILEKPPETENNIPWRVLNVGSTRSESIMDFVRLIERELGMAADLEYKPMQAGDIKETTSDITETTALTGYRPTTSIAEGVPRVIEWHMQYYKDRF